MIFVVITAMTAEGGVLRKVLPLFL